MFSSAKSWCVRTALENATKHVGTSVAAALLVLVSMQARAQYDPYFSHYYDMQTSFNPAAAGKEDRLNVYGAYAMTLAGFENAPKTMYFAGDMPFVAVKTVHGVGLLLMSDQLGLFAHQRLAGQYAVRLNALGGRLSIGVQPGVITEKFRGSGLELEEDNDPVFSKSDVDGNAFDLAAGIYYARRNWYAGISGQHITYPTVALGERNELKIDGMYCATGGMTFDLRNPYVKIATSAIVRTDLTAYRADVTGRVLYSFDGNMLYAGVSYSPTNSATLLLGGRLKGVLVGYSFEAYTNGIGLRNGSHELFVGYQMDVDLGKKGKNRHQTTRTL